MSRGLKLRTRYRATLDRTGWALLTGGAAIGCAVTALGLASGASAPTLVALAIGATLAGAVGIAALGGPLWWLQRRGGRGPVAAAVTGAAVAAFVTLAATTHGFGSGLPPVDAAALGVMWTSAMLTAAVAGFVGALVALAMWLVGYRSA